MRYFVVLLSVVVLGFVAGCSKSNSQAKPAPGDSTNNGSGGTQGGGTGGTTGGLSFANSDYEGVATLLSREWLKPILVHFNADSTVVDYCYFYMMVDNNWISPDSMTGKIVSISNPSGSGPSVRVYFKDIADTQTYNFSADLSGVSGGSNGLASNQFYFNSLTKLTKPAASLLGDWYTDTSKAPDGTNGLPYFPDIDGITFFGSSMGAGYFRNGAAYSTGIVGIPPGVQPVYEPYLQVGYRVYFWGLDEVTNKFISYFGILSNDGTTITADTRDFIDARVPTYVQTIAWYGPSGTTPVMHKSLH